VNSPFVIEVVFGEYYHGLCDVYCVKRALKYRRNIPVSIMSADTDLLLPNHAVFHCRMRQVLQTPESNMYNFLYIMRLNPQITRHFKREISDVVSQIL